MRGGTCDERHVEQSIIHDVYFLTGENVREVGNLHSMDPARPIPFRWIVIVPKRNHRHIGGDFRQKRARPVNQIEHRLESRSVQTLQQIQQLPFTAPCFHA